jgi:hypothetical protein
VEYLLVEGIGESWTYPWRTRQHAHKQAIPASRIGNRNTARPRELIRGRRRSRLRSQHRQPERLLHLILGVCLRFFYNKTTTLAQRTIISLLRKTAGQLNLPRTSCFPFVCLVVAQSSDWAAGGVLSVGVSSIASSVGNRGSLSSAVQGRWA